MKDKVMRITISNSVIQLFSVSSVLFWMNINHGAEHTIWTGRYLPAAINVEQIGQYSLDGNSIASYPIWGYSLLALLADKIFGCYEAVLVFQYLLFVLSLIIVCKRFYRSETEVILTEKLLFFGCVIFFSMVLSVKWPDAILSFLLFITVVFSLDKKYTAGAVCLSLAYNFRPEALIFLMVYLIYLFFVIRVKTKLRLVVVSLVFISPWSIYQYTHTDRLLLGSSNTPAVIYITLGQLPGNKWNRVHNDRSATEYVRSRGVDDPMGYRWRFDTEKRSR